MTTRPATMRGAAIVAAVRTPVGTFGGSLRAAPVEDLAATTIKAAMERTVTAGNASQQNDAAEAAYRGIPVTLAALKKAAEAD